MNPFDVYHPSSSEAPVIVDIPHSGISVPAQAAWYFSAPFMEAKVDTDWHLDKMFDFLADYGATILKNNIFRYVIDLNREVKRPYLGPWSKALVAENKPEDTPFDGPVYTSLPSKDEIEKRIQEYYVPYHRMLRHLIGRSLERFGKTCLVSMHSYVGMIEEDVCVANGNGTSCSQEIMDVFEAGYTNAGYRVARNKVFRGGFITRHYGRLQNVDAICVEHRCSTYLLEGELDQPFPPSADNDKFLAARTKLMGVYTDIFEKICQLYATYAED